MIVKDYICEGGKSSELNEDYIVWKDKSFVLVLDGSTGLTDMSPPEEYCSWAKWFVVRFAELISNKIREHIGIGTLVAECIEVLRKEYDRMSDCKAGSKDKLSEPSASMALLVDRGDRVELGLLGDISILVKYNDYVVEHVHCGRVEKLDKRVFSLMEEVRLELDDKSIKSVMADSRVKELLATNRLKKNSGEEDGYWILGLDKEAAYHIEIYNWYRRYEGDTKSILLCTDGFSAYYYDYRKDWLVSTFNKMENDSLSTVYKELREIEDADKDCIVYTRYKTHDDAAAVLVEL